MAKWEPSADVPDLTPRPAFGVGPHPHGPDPHGPHSHGHPPPPHVMTYDGLAHISQQVDEVQKELAEIRSLLEQVLAAISRGQ